MSPALSSLLSATKRTPLALSTSVQRCSYVKSDKIKLLLTIFTSEDVVQVNISAASGDMYILANHVPSIEPLRPGILEVIKSGNTSNKWFVSGGFANIHPGNHLTISNVVAGAPLKSFSLEAVHTNLQKALRTAAGTNGSEDLKLEAQIEADVYKALQHALSSK
ncbi:epsilon subunit of F1F0-ATP synthase N-terminal domain-containing protein [Imleria badia]|nr:epsilon subunit of F1F0-ATP synthase N-terminal domain-containing protein [Imleria badia]